MWEALREKVFTQLAMFDSGKFAEQVPDDEVSKHQTLIRLDTAGKNDATDQKKEFNFIE